MKNIIKYLWITCFISLLPQGAFAQVRTLPPALGNGPASSIQVENLQQALIEEGKKLYLSFSLTHPEELSEIVLQFDQATQGGAFLERQASLVSYTPYYYLGDIYLVFRDQKVPFQNGKVELKVDIPNELVGKTSQSFTLRVFDKNLRPTTPLTRQYQ